MSSAVIVVPDSGTSHLVTSHAMFRFALLGLFWLVFATAPISAQSPPAMSPVGALAFSPDGSRLAVARGTSVTLFTTADWKHDRTLEGAEFRVNAVAWRADGAKLAAAEGEPGVAGAARVWSFGPGGIPAGDPQLLEGQDDSLYGVAFLADGRQLATCGYDKRVQLWDVESGKPAASLVHHTAAVFGLAATKDGKFLATASADSTVKVWSASEGKRLATFTESTKGLAGIAMLPGDKELVAVGEDRMLRVWSWSGTAGKLVRSAFAHEGAILAIAVSPDGSILYTSAEDGQVKAWDSVTLRELHDYPNFPDWPQALAVSPDGNWLAVGRFDGRVTILKAREGGPGRELASATPLNAGRGAPWWVAALLSQADAAAGDNKAEKKDDKPAEKKVEPPKPLRLDNVTPKLVVRGTKVTLTFTGQSLWNADGLQVDSSDSGTLLDAKSVTLLPGDEKKPNERQGTLEIPSEFIAGRPIRFRWQSPRGGTDAKSIHVLAFPEVPEKEPNDTFAAAPTVTLPATLRGTIIKRGDVDEWKVDGKRGEEVSLHLLAAGLGSALSPVVSVRDASGKILLSTRRQMDGEIAAGFRMPDDGPYTIRVEDRSFTGGGNHFYALHIGKFPVVTDSFPRGFQTHHKRSLEHGPLTVRGFNLGGEAVPGESKMVAPDQPSSQTIDVVTSGDRRHDAPVRTPNGPSLNRVRYVVTTSPELVEAESFPNAPSPPNNDTPQTAVSLTIPCAFNGRISAPAPATPGADVDCVSFEATKGQKLTLEVEAGRFGSTLDSQLEILDDSGAPLVRSTLRCVAETLTVLRDHDSKVPGIRLQAWDDFRPNEFLLLGGEVVRIRVLPLGPDEDVKFFERDGRRLGWLGTTPQAHALSSAAYKVEVHPPGTNFPPTGMPVVPLHWRNDDGGAEFLGDSRILFDVPRDGRYYARIGDARGTGGDSHFYRLVVRERQEGFKVSINPEHPNLPVGDTLPVNVTVDRLDGFSGPVELSVDGLPTGVTAILPLVSAHMHTTTIGLRAEADLPPETLGKVHTLRFQARGVSSSGQIVEARADCAVPMSVAANDANADTTRMSGLVNDRPHALAFLPPPDLVTKLEPAFVEMVPGQETRFTATIERRNGLDKRIPVDVLGLPHGLRVLDVGLNGVLVNENETSRSFVVVCDEWAPEGDHVFFAAGRIESKGNERHGSGPAVIRVMGR
jgi:hypothetical protein